MILLLTLFLAILEIVGLPISCILLGNILSLRRRRYTLCPLSTSRSHTVTMNAADVKSKDKNIRFLQRDLPLTDGDGGVYISIYL